MQQSAMGLALARARSADDSRTMIGMSRFLHMIWALAVLMGAATYAAADAVGQREDQFKAAYVFNFMKFVTWPDGEASQTLTVCFVGAEGVYRALAQDIEKKRVGARRLTAVKLDGTPDVGTCNALYIGAAMMADYVLGEDWAVLTISDARSFVDHGGMIELFTENHRLRFLINVRNAQQAGLRISSDLLKLAAGVRRES